MKKRISRELADKIGQTYSDYRVNLDTLAREYGVPRSNVVYWARRLGISPRPKGLGKSNGIDLSIPKCNEKFFEVMDSSIKFYLLGLLITDGNIYKRKNPIRPFVVSFYSRDLDLVNIFADALEFSGSIVERRSKNKLLGYCVEIISNKLGTDLEKLGVFPNKTYTAKFPEFFTTIQNKDFIADFFRGCVDGDGWVGNWEKKLKVPFSIGFCGTFDLVDAWRRFCKEICGTEGKTIRHGKDNCFVFKVCGNPAIKVAQRLYYNRNYSSLFRKIDVFKKWEKELNL